MTKEQEEAIERLEYYLRNSAYKRIDDDFFKNGGWEIVGLEIPEAIKTVLFILKEKDKEIDDLNKKNRRFGKRTRRKRKIHKRIRTRKNK